MKSVTNSIIGERQEMDGKIARSEQLNTLAIPSEQQLVTSQDIEKIRHEEFFVKYSQYEIHRSTCRRQTGDAPNHPSRKGLISVNHHSSCSFESMRQNVALENLHTKPLLGFHMKQSMLQCHDTTII